MIFLSHYMIHVQRIDTLDLPELAPYRTMRRQLEHRREGIFVAESDKVVRRLLESQFPVVSLLLPERWFYQLEPLLAKRPEELTVYLLEKENLEQLTGFTFYQGVLAVGRIPDPPTLDELLSPNKGPLLLVGVQGLTNAENLGGLVRNCVAFGASGLLVDQTSCSPYLRRAVRGSMGTIFRIPAMESLRLADTVRTLRSRGVHCVAAHPRPQAQRLGQAEFPRPCCVVFGSEGYGIADEIVQACDAAVAIPMAQGVDSLNVGSAAAVFLYELSRR